MGDLRTDQWQFESYIVLACIHDHRIREYVLSIIPSEIFAEWEARYLYETVLKYQNNKRPINFISIQDRIRRDHAISEERRTTLVDFLQPWVDPQNAGFLDTIVYGILPRLEDEVGLRLIDKFLSDAVTLRQDENVQEIFKLLDKVRMQSVFRKPIHKEFWKTVLGQTKKEDYWRPGIPIGLKGYNEDMQMVWFDDSTYYNGVGRGQICIIQGDSSIGKTTLLLNIALFQSLMGYIVNYYSLEMDLQYLFARGCSALIGIPTIEIPDLIEKGELDKKLKVITDKFPNKKDIEFFHHPAHSLNAGMIKQDLAESERRGRKVDCVIIDYLDIMGSSRHWKERYLELEYITVESRSVGVEFDTAVISISSENRQDLKGKYATKRQASGSYGKVYGSDIWIPARYEKVEQTDVNGKMTSMDQMIITPDKNRYGRRGEKFSTVVNYDTGRMFDIFPVRQRLKEI